MNQDSVSPLLDRLFQEDLKMQDELYRVAAQAMPKVMMAFLEELRGIPHTVPLAMEFQLHYHQPKFDPPAMHVTKDLDFSHFEFKAPTPEIVLKTRTYMNDTKRVRNVIVSTMGLPRLHELAEHLAVDTIYETYIGPYKWDQNWVLKHEKS